MAPTQRPFFSNFFSAFRARTSPPTSFPAKTAPTITSPTSLSPTSHTSSTAASANSSSQPRTISTKSTTDTAAVTSPTRTTTSSNPFSPNTTRSYAAPPLSRSPAGGTSSPSSGGIANPNLAVSPPGTSTPLTRGRQRRGSDSSNSSGGFMDALGAGEKWYVGGRNGNNGEETFYRLGLVQGGKGKRVGSLDRLSL